MIEHEIDIFIDVRRRRGLRGAKYKFANSKYLQDKLKSLNIDYLYLKELSPSKDIRELQKKTDTESNTSKKKRVKLSDDFVSAYRNECLKSFDFIKFTYNYEYKNIVFFCVEEKPKACHRYLITEELEKYVNTETYHIIKE